MAPKKANKQAPAGKKGAEKMAGAGGSQGAGTKRSRKELEATEGDDNDQEVAMKAQNTSTGRAAGSKDAADAGRASVDGEQADGPPHRSAVINANPLSETGPESSSNGGDESNHPLIPIASDAITIETIPDRSNVYILHGPSKTVEEMELMASGAGMMQANNAMQQKNYPQLFKAEKDYYEIVNYEFALNEIEEAFMLKHKAKKQ